MTKYAEEAYDRIMGDWKKRAVIFAASGDEETAETCLEYADGIKSLEELYRRLSVLQYAILLEIKRRAYNSI